MGSSNIYQYAAGGNFLMGGNVGIGTTAPAYQLHLSTDSDGKPSTNTWTIASDARVKTDIHDFADGLDIVCGIRPVTYRYNGKAGFTDTKRVNIGIIGQEIKNENNVLKEKNNSLEARLIALEEKINSLQSVAY